MTRPAARPGSGRPDWLDAGLGHVWRPYTQMKTAPEPLPVIGAEGCRLHLADGRVLIDGVASWWTAAHGYRHPHIRAAVAAQLDQLPHVMLGGLAHEQPWRLATRLAALLPGDLNRVFFSESGSVSVEIAMKMAMQFWFARGERRTRFLSFAGGYHGDTLATMSVCDPEEGMHALFRGALADQFVIGLPVDGESEAAFRALLDRHAHEIAAVIVEPLVQGAGGMRFHDAETLRRLRRGCDDHGLLLVFDEIFTGFARTGRGLFACEAAGVVPDIVTLSKALTGGTLPLAATVASDRVFDAFLDDRADRALMHGPTYMGNALACAAANASLDLFEREPLVDRAAAIGRRLESALAPARNLPGVVDVRVMGAIGVIQLDIQGADRVADDLPWLRRRFVEEGVWLRPFGDILYTTPPLVVDDADLDRIAAAMLTVARDWSRRFR